MDHTTQAPRWIRPYGDTHDDGRVQLSFTLPVAAHARLAIHDIQGREVAVLADNEFAPGTRSFEFSPQASGASPGLYFAVLRSGDRTLVRRFTVFQ